MSSIISIENLLDNWQTRDPFLFCRHHTDFFPAATQQLGPGVSMEGRQLGNDFSAKDGWSMYHGKTVPGFPAHPHRGFETITMIERGLVDHADSVGNTGRYGFGDVQWMTAGSGIQHSEMSPLVDTENPNPKESFQIWLNLPSENKFVAPDYKMMWQEEIPVIKHRDNKGRLASIKLVAGSWGNQQAIAPPAYSWAADPQHDVCIWKVTLSPFSSLTLPVASMAKTRDLYFYEGDGLVIDDQKLTENQLAQLDAQAVTTLTATATPCEILILQGEAINEPVAQHGPFVMNTEQELREAFNDYERTEFGGWPWPRLDMVHGKDQPRFSWQGGLGYVYPGRDVTLDTKEKV